MIDTSIIGIPNGDDDEPYHEPYESSGSYPDTPLFWEDWNERL